MIFTGKKGLLSSVPLLGLIVVGGSVSSQVKGQESCITWSDFSSQAVTQMFVQGAPSASEVELNAKLVFRSLIKEKDTQWLGFQLFEPQNLLDKKPISSSVYSVPFAVKVNKVTNVAEDFIFNGPLKPEDQDKLKSIYKTFSVVAPVKGDDPKDYVRIETDDIGQYSIRYQYHGPVSGKKNKLSYEKIGWTDRKNVFSEVQDVIIHHDELKFEHGKCWLSHAQGQSDIEVITVDDFLHLRVRQSQKLSVRKDSPSPEIRLLKLPNDPTLWDKLAYEEIYPPAEAQPMASGKAFIQALSALDLSKLAHKELQQLLYDNQIYIHLLKAPLLNGVFDNEDEARLFLMLGIVDVPSAHALLTDIFLDEEFDHEARFRTLMALKYAKTPLESELVDEIFNYAAKPQEGSYAELAHSSMMVIGIISRNQMDTEFGTELGERLALELAKTPREDSKAALLTALGNSGDMTHQPVIAQYLESDSSILRERSAEALFHMPSERTLKVLSTNLPKEESSRTRQAILRSMGPNKLSSSDIQLVYKYASESAEGDTRRAAITALIKQKDHDVDVKPQLKALVKKEKTEANLRDIMKALYSK